MQWYGRWTGALLGCLVVGASACSTLVGADFDGLHLPNSDAGVSRTDPAMPEAPDEADGSAAFIPTPIAPEPDGSCAEGRKKCDGLCVSVLDPAYGCATSSCAPCSIAHGAAACREGVCAVGACEAERADCNNNPTDGCETNLDTSPLHCGACNDAACAGGLVC